MENYVNLFKSLTTCYICVCVFLAGIVIKFENMSYKTALHYSHQVLGLASKASRYVKQDLKDLFDANENEVESIRLKTQDYEMVMAQHGNYTMIAMQTPVSHKGGTGEIVEGAESEKKDGEEKKEPA